jgi:hypothetical protein
MQGEVALVHEQGQDFAVLAVKPHVVQSPSQREEMVAAGHQWFGVRTVLLAEDGRTWGATDIVNRLRSVHVSQLPWRTFSV